MTKHCAVCGVEMTTADADHAVKTDAGPVHRECFDGPVPPPDTPDFLPPIDLEEEEAARRDHNDVPLDPGPDRGDGFHNAMAAGIGVVDGIVCADDRSRQRIQRMVREDLETPLDPDRRF